MHGIGSADSEAWQRIRRASRTGVQKVPMPFQTADFNRFCYDEKSACSFFINEPAIHPIIFVVCRTNTG